MGKTLRESMFGLHGVDDEPVRVNPVVDPLQSKTDPMNTDQAPQSEFELSVAIKDLVQGMRLSPQDAYGLIKKALEKGEEDMKQTQLESIIRKHVKSILNEAMPRGTGQSAHKVRWNPKVSAEYSPTGAESGKWKKDVADLRGRLSRSTFGSDKKAAQKAGNLYGEFSGKDIKELFAMMGEKDPGNQTVLTDRALAAIKGRVESENFVQSDKFGPELLQDYAESIGVPLTPELEEEIEGLYALQDAGQLEQSDVVGIFVQLALIKSRLSPEVADSIKASLLGDVAPENLEYAREKAKAFVNSDEFLEWCVDKGLADESSGDAAILNMQQRMLSYLIPVFAKEGPNPPSDKDFDKVKDVLNALVRGFKKFVMGEDATDEPYEITR